MTKSDLKCTDEVLVHQRLKKEISDNKELVAALTVAKQNNAIFVANKGNLGDGLIQLGTYTLFEELGWRPRVRTGFSARNYEGTDWVVVGGGGAWVEGQYEEHARSARAFLERGGQMILLPSSVQGYEEYFRRYAASVQIFVRERFSYDRLKIIPELEGRVHLCHDLAFAVSPNEFMNYRNSIKSGSVNLFREDAESACLDVPRDNFDLALVANNGLWGSKEECLAPILAAAGFLSQFETVRTDRLHMSVLSAMLGCNVHMKSNSYFKNAGVFDFSIRRFDNVKFEHNINNHGRSASSGSSGGVEALSSRSKILETELLALSRLRREYLEPEILRLQAYASSLEARLGESNQLLEAELLRTKDFESRLALSENRLSHLTDHVVPDLEVQNEKLKATEQEYLTRINQNLEPEIERLMRQVEELERDQYTWFSAINEEKTRTIFYASQIDRLASQSETYQKQLHELQKMKEEWFEPEINRLNTVISEFECIRRSWFEPEMERLHNLLTQYEVVKREWFEPEMERLHNLLTQCEVVKREWFEPEMERLHNLLTQCEVVKREWFEPEMERLHNLLTQCEVVKREWFEPQLKNYQEALSQCEADKTNALVKYGSGSLLQSVKRVLGL